MFSNFIAKAFCEDDEENGFSEYRAIGTAWFEETEPGLLERISLSCAGWRDGRRGLVEITDGTAHSAYLNALRAKALAEIVSLSQLRHSQLSEARDEIERLAFSIPSKKARLKELEAKAQEAARNGEQAVVENEEELIEVRPSAFESHQRDREASQLRRALDNDQERIISLRSRQAFLRNDAMLKLDLLIERYHERAARYLRAVDGCRRHALCAEVQPPSIQSAGEAVMEKALRGDPLAIATAVVDEETTAATAEAATSAAATAANGKEAEE